jgi:hypothetical protein
MHTPLRRSFGWQSFATRGLFSRHLLPCLSTSSDTEHGWGRGGGQNSHSRYEALGSPSAATVRVMPVKLPRSTRQSFWTCAKQTGSDGFFNERERLLRFTRFRFGCLSAELHRRQLILNGFESRLSLLRSPGGVL